MLKKEYYLIGETDEAVRMRQRISAMLECNDESQVILGLQLLKGGGVHPAFFAHLLALSVWGGTEWENRKEICKDAKKIFQKWVSPEMLLYQKQNPLPSISTLQKLDIYSESSFCEFIADYCSKASLNTGDIMTMSMITFNRGAKYIIEHQSRPINWTIAELLKRTSYHKTLNFPNYQLTELPPEIGNFPDIQLINLIGNPLDDIPDSFKNLRNMQGIAFNHKELSERALTKLGDFFPDILAEQYFTKACDEKRKVKGNTFPKPNPNPNYLEAINLFERGCKIKPEYAELWHNVGACWIFYGLPENGREALEKAAACYQSRLNDLDIMLKSKTSKTHNLFWLSCVYALQQEKEKGLEILRYFAKEKQNYYLGQAREEEDWFMYRNDEDFIAICGNSPY